MSDFIINLRKMKTSLDLKNNACYHLDAVNINSVLGKKVSFLFLGEINCISCGKPTKKSFHYGYCFPCVRRLPACDLCMVKPELCHFHKGTCRNPTWGEKYCFSPHIVYLANTSNSKVGITQERNIPSRWIDQGATQVLPIMKVSKRILSGLIEVKLGTYLSDKTNWRAMLRKKTYLFDNLSIIWEDLLSKEEVFISDMQCKYGVKCVEILENRQEKTIHYPILIDPDKINIQTLNLDKKPLVEGTLLGIKGQYLIFDTGVINIRKFSGYKCKITIC